MNNMHACAFTSTKYLSKNDMTVLCHNMIYVNEPMNTHLLDYSFHIFDHKYYHIML